MYLYEQPSTIPAFSWSGKTQGEKMDRKTSGMPPLGPLLMQGFKAQPALLSP